MIAPTSPCPARPETRRAFTLIELLVVIAIIALVAALLLPAFARAKGKATWVKELHGIRQTNMLICIEAEENDTFFQLPDDWTIVGKRGSAPKGKTNSTIF